MANTGSTLSCVRTNLGKRVNCVSGFYNIERCRDNTFLLEVPRFICAGVPGFPITISTEVVQSCNTRPSAFSIIEHNSLA